MSKEKISEKIYNKLKADLLDAGYLNNNLIIGAKFLKNEDEKYLEKVNSIQDYLFQKIKEGDGVAYALKYVAEEDVLSKVSDLHDFDKIANYLLTHTDLQSDNNDFFDPKIVYFAEVLGEIHESY